MEYNPKIHNRRSIRMQGYDYSQAGAYFITICCYKKICKFGMVSTEQPETRLVLNEYGHIAYNEWIKLPERFENVELNVFQIMPNHMHGIIVLNNGNTVGAELAPAPDNMGVNAVSENNDVPGSSRAGASPAPTWNTGINAVSENNDVPGSGRAGASPAPTWNTGINAVSENNDLPGSSRAGASPAPTWNTGINAVSENNDMSGLSRAGASPAPTRNTDINAVSENNDVPGPGRAGASPAPTRNTDINAVSENNDMSGLSRAGASPAPTIGNIVGAYKSIVANNSLEHFKNLMEIDNTPKNELLGKIWQRNYYEHIIRNEQEYYRIAEYIINNPQNWQRDIFYK